MVRRYNSFLVRYWIFDGDTRRLQIEHIQSGDRVHVASPEEAMEWIRAYCETPAAAAHREKPPRAMAHSNGDASRG